VQDHARRVDDAPQTARFRALDGAFQTFDRLGQQRFA
jgi:hypothetical protein